MERSAGQGNMVFVDPVVLERVDARIHDLLGQSGVLAVLLVESSGVVLTSAGECPLHPTQVGSLTAGVVSALRALMKAARAEEFFITMPAISMSLDVQQVDARLFLCAFYGDDADNAHIREAMRQIAAESRHSLRAGPNDSDKQDNISFIAEKLSEILHKT